VDPFQEELTMPRCPAHCPPSNSGPLLPAAIIAGVFAIAATWTVIVHILTILLITLGIIAVLGTAGLATIAIIRLRGLAREPRAPARNLQAPTRATRTIQAATIDRRQITSGRVPAAGCQQNPEAEHRSTPAIEQHWHLHLHGTSGEQPARVLGHTPGAPKQAQLPRDAGGHHDA
jgi:hypothetical protein